MTLANSASVALPAVDTLPIYTAPTTTAPKATPTPAQTLAAYQHLSGAERFDFIKAIYNRLGESITDKAVGAQWSSLAHRLSCKVGQVNRADRTCVIKDILTSQNTRFSRAYGELDTNARLAFWHRLVRSLNPYRHSQGFPSAAVQDLVAQAERLSADQQLEFLSQTVSQMGV